jgi:hypothetical protein
MSEHDIEQVEKGYRGIMSGLLGMLHGFEIASVVRRSRLNDQQWAERGQILRASRQQIELALREWKKTRDRITWTLTPYTRRRERLVERRLKELHFEDWRTGGQGATSAQ